MRALVETGALTGEPGAYRLPRPLETVRVPATVQAVLAARIDRLPAEREARCSRRPRSIGKDVPFAVLRRHRRLPARTSPAGLAGLQAAELLYEASLFPSPSTPSSTP